MPIYIYRSGGAGPRGPRNNFFAWLSVLGGLIILGLLAVVLLPIFGAVVLFLIGACAVLFIIFCVKRWLYSGRSFTEEFTRQTETVRERFSRRTDKRPSAQRASLLKRAREDSEIDDAVEVKDK